MRALVRAALVIARRDYVATVFSRTFLLFLLGPVLPLLFGLAFGAIGAGADEAARPTVVAIASPADAHALRAARDRLAARLGAGALPPLRFVTPRENPRAQARRLLGGEHGGSSAVLSGGLDRPVLTGPRAAIGSIDEDIALILDEAQQLRALGRTAPPPVSLEIRPTERSAATSVQDRAITARAGQIVLLVLTAILSGMLLTNLVEEKSSKVIEILAAAVPVDAIFLGKLIAMLGMSLTGIAVWGAVAAAGALAMLPPEASLPQPAVGWGTFLLLGLAYFVAGYLLLGGLFLGIGAQASTAREVQTLSLPVTMGQLIVFALASAAVARPGSGVAIAAALFPWSSPLAMFARAAQSALLWPHLLAILWQAGWVAVVIRIAARRFRVSVLDSRGARRGWFGWRRIGREGGHA